MRFHEQIESVAAGRSLRGARPRAPPCVHRRRRAHARDRHRRDHRDLQRRERAPAASAAVRAPGRADEGLAGHAGASGTRRSRRHGLVVSRSSWCFATRSDRSAISRSTPRTSSRRRAATSSSFAVESVGATYLRTLGITPSRGRRLRSRSIDAHAGRGASRSSSPTRCGSVASTPIRPSSARRSSSIAIRTSSSASRRPDFTGLSGQADLFVPITTRPADDLVPTAVARVLISSARRRRA